MRKRIVKYLSCLIPNKKLRKRFRKRFENSKPNIELLNQKIELLDYKLNLFLNGVKITQIEDNGLYKIYNNNQFVGIGVIENNLLKRDIIIL